MPLTKSYGVFTSANAVRPLSKRDLERLYWKTSNQQHFEGRQHTEEDLNESLDQVHLVGQRDTKHMEYQEKRAPLVDRTACSYTTEFIAKPAGDSAANRIFAEGLKGNFVLKSAPSLGTQTTYHDAFNQGRTEEELRKAKFPPQGDRQARTRPILTCGGSREKVSYTQSEHRGPHRDLQAQGTKAYHKSNLTLPGGRSREFWTTQYERDSQFCKANAWPQGASPSGAAAREFLQAPSPSGAAARGRPAPGQARLRLAIPPNVELP